MIVLAVIGFITLLAAALYIGFAGLCLIFTPFFGEPRLGALALLVSAALLFVAIHFAPITLTLKWK